MFWVFFFYHFIEPRVISIGTNNIYKKSVKRNESYSKKKSFKRRRVEYDTLIPPSASTALRKVMPFTLFFNPKILLAIVSFTTFVVTRIDSTVRIKADTADLPSTQFLLRRYYQLLTIFNACCTWNPVMIITGLLESQGVPWNIINFKIII